MKKQLWGAFRDLKLAAYLTPRLEAASRSPEWDERLVAVKALLRHYTDAIIQRGVLAPEMLEHLPEAKNRSAWSNSEWQRYARIAQDAGYDPQDGWVWGLWRWAQSWRPGTAVREVE